MSEYQLHCFAQSGNAYKAALMLNLIDAEWEPIWVDFFNGGSKTPEYLAINEMGEVPALIDGTNTVTQSGVILDYLSSKHGKFGATSADHRREIMRWILWDNHKLTANISTVRAMMNFLAPEKRKQDVIDFLLGRAKTAMKVLNNRLANQRWIVGDTMTTADLSCVGYLFFDGEFGIDLADYPKVALWRDAIAALPGWKHPYDLMPGHPLAERKSA